MPNSILPALTNFNNIKIANNESIDFYSLNRSFSRLQNVATTVLSDALTGYVMTDIPYSSDSSYGYSRFTSSMASSDNTNIISTALLSTYLDSSTPSASAVYIQSNAFKVCSGGGSLMNGMNVKYGFTEITSGTTFDATSSYTFSGKVLFNPNDFTIEPMIYLQILDAGVNYNKFVHKYTLSSVNTSSFSYTIYTRKTVSDSVDKLSYHLSWLAIGA